MNNPYLEQLWQLASVPEMGLASVCGVVVGIIYFECLRWSVEHLYGENQKHRYGLFAMLALFRIAMFFGVLVLIAKRNVILIMCYILAFFITKGVIVWIEKKRFTGNKQVKKDTK